MEGLAEVAPCPVGRVHPVAVCLVDDDDIGHLHQAALYPLELVARTGDEQEAEGVDQVGHLGLGLADPDRFDQDYVIPGGLAEEDRLAGLPGHSA